MTPTIRYPSGPITPHGSYHILHDRIPQMALRAYDDSIVFNIMGGLAIPDRQIPERVELKELSGLVPPWKTVDQKGATQDGVTFVDALYDPIEVIAGTVVHGRSPAHARRVYRDLMASLDAKQTSELSFFTHDLGRWWAPVRWFKTPDDKVAIINNRRQPVSLRLRADSGFWQSYPHVQEFRFSYLSSVGDFTTDHASDAGSDWTIALSGSGSGGVRVSNGEIQSTLTSTRRAVLRRAGYTSTTNNQVVEIQIGTIGQWFYPPSASIAIWVRLNTSGTAGTSGVRLLIESHRLTVSYFIGGVETVMRTIDLLIPPRVGETFALVAGVAGSERSFKVMRGGATIMNFSEVGTGSPLGVSNRGAGVELHSAGAPSIRQWHAGDNVTKTQSGFISRVNMGDQPWFDRYTCVGPGTFRFGNGPGSTDMIEFGPLLPNQIAQINSDPRKRSVRDLSVVPTGPPAAAHSNALLDILSFATANNITHVLDILQSITGLLSGHPSPVPPQGNLFSLLKGRWSNPIPAKSPGKPPQEYHIKVEIAGGNADSKIIAAGTPLRRNPY